MYDKNLVTWLIWGTEIGRRTLHDQDISQSWLFSTEITLYFFLEHFFFYEVKMLAVYCNRWGDPPEAKLIVRHWIWLICHSLVGKSFRLWWNPYPQPSLSPVMTPNEKWTYIPSICLFRRTAEINTAIEPCVR